jgi:stage II sporulation protein D
MFRSLILALLVVVSSTGFSAERKPTDPTEKRMHGLLRSLGHSAPIMRVGLDDAHSLELTSRAPFRLIDKNGNRIWPGQARQLRIVAEGGPVEGAGKVYSIQVGAYSDEDSARRSAEDYKQKFNTVTAVRHDADRNIYRVRLGRESDRTALNRLLSRLRASGLTDVWVAEDPAEVPGGVRLRLVDSDWNSKLPGVDRIFAIPAADADLKLEGVAYRGILEIRASRYGTLRGINWVDLELYLRGVVPAELGPAVWPQLEAQKAQAVAARTYVWRHREQFIEDGYDLCATPRCQVYKGKAAEHPLSDRAISATRHQILAYKGKPINSYFTSTCGGHTENVENVFPEEAPADRPYLRGVPCRAEKELLERLGGRVEGLDAGSRRDPSGVDITRQTALLSALGILDKADLEALERPVTSEQLLRWAKRLNKIVGRESTPLVEKDLHGLGAAIEMWWQAVGWSERPRVLVEEADLPGLLRGWSEPPYTPQDRALAYAVFRGSITPLREELDAKAPAPAASRLIATVFDVAETWNASGLRSGTVSEVHGKKLELAEGQGHRTIVLAPSVLLLRGSGETFQSVSALTLWPGDRIRYREGANGKVTYLELRPPIKGLSDDRSSSRYAWEVRKSRAQLARSVGRRLSVGDLVDLIVLKRGVSGRISELEVVGTSGRVKVQGFDVRRLLDLQESLTVVEPIRNRSGRLTAVVFAGKGWGHGVGMCQVGAYGMALRGEKYRDSLSHYYQGSSLRRIR